MKIAVTLLDSYRYWKETEFMDPERERQAGEEVIARIRGQKPPKNEHMLRGIAFADILEKPDEYFDPQSGFYCRDGFEFDGPSVREFMLMIPPDAMREVWMPQSKIREHRLVARADIMYGNTIGDAKLITKPLNAAKYDSYEESIQWQAELLMADCDKFEYYIGQASISKKTDVITIKKMDKLVFYRSQATDERVIKLAKEFAQFAEPYLPEDER